MKQLWERVSNFGIDFAENVSERKSVVLINRMSLVLAWIMTIFALMAVFLGMFPIIGFPVSFIISFLLPVYFQKRGWLTFAKYFFTFCPILGITAICMFNSAEMGDKFFFFTTSTIPILIFNHKGQRYLFFLVSIAGFYFATWYQSNFVPVQKFSAQEEMLYWTFGLMSVFAILYYVLQYFRSGNEDYENELEIKNDVIEEKNKDILSSIHYAKRIQGVLLASDKLLKKQLPDYFIFYKPKDIVSGDFYWADETPEGKFLFLTGDCTGHGVPGAFMSLLNISFLHELTLSHKIARPDLLLNAQRDSIISSLNPEGTEELSRDGMDCVLCSFDFKNKKLDFACANNPLWLYRNGEIIEYKADKQAVGLSGSEKKDFTLQSIQLVSGDIVYTITDGFADQFGGEKGKKFRYAQLKQKLVAIAQNELSEQKSILEKTFDEWKGNLEQVDDVLIIGVKIS